MSWPCFLIERVQPVVEFAVICPAKHRTVVESMPGVDLSESPPDPGEGWPEVCPECAVTMDYGDGQPGARAMHFKIGGWTWRRPDTGEEHRHPHLFGPGAMYDITDHSPEDWRGPDGLAWAVIVPPGAQWDEFRMDGPATGGGRWSRTGVAPKLTVSPSILTPHYHGYLNEGVLTDSLPDRPL